MEKGRYDKAYNSVKRLRHHPVQATRDMYYAYKLLQVERGEREGRNLLKEFFTVRRNRRAAQSAWFCMVSQRYQPKKLKLDEIPIVYATILWR